VRCSSTGETCFIDAAGRVVSRLPLGSEGVLFVDAALLEETPAAIRWRWALPRASGIALVGLVARRRLRGLGGLAELEGTPTGPGR
jgi:apolipoprotein N-acyltransferase